MHRYARAASIAHHLVDDDIVELNCHSHRFSFRLRIWRSRAGPSIVLASQLTEGAPPCWLRTRLANLAYSAYLCYPEAGMLYFEAEKSPGARLVQVAFESLGFGLRRQLVSPTERARDWRELEEIVGSEVSI